jgi:predicted DNA-binding transcriptional regulator AlpA
MKQPNAAGLSEYISPKEVSRRWQCSRSSVDRIARRNHFTRVCLGEGGNGMVRYLRKEVEEYEENRRVVMS